MAHTVRSQKTEWVDFDGELVEVEVLEIPFREGVELRCVVNGEEIRVSDRGLGYQEALRVLRDEVRQFRETGA